jgi:hypothetical protein
MTVSKVVSKARIHGVRSQLDALVAKGRREHLGGVDQSHLMRLAAEQKYLTQKRARQLRTIRDGKE